MCDTRLELHATMIHYIPQSYPKIQNEHRTKQERVCIYMVEGQELIHIEGHTSRGRMIAAFKINSINFCRYEKQHEKRCRMSRCPFYTQF